MSILWCGGEDIDFPNGNAVSVTNNSGFWSRSGYTRCSLSSSGGISKSTYFPGGPVTSAWITFRWRPDNSAKTVGVGVEGSARSLWLGFAGSGWTHLQLSTYDGTTLTPLTITDGAILVDALQRIDWHIQDFGAAATVTVYVDGALVLTYTGDVTVPGMTDFSCLVLGSGYLRGSEFVVSDQDTRLFSLVTLYPTGAGDANTFTAGGYGDVDESVISDADTAHSDTPEQDLQVALADLPAGDFIVKAVKLAARITAGDGGMGMQIGVKTNSTLALGSTITLVGAWETHEALLAANPVTANVFTPAEINALQLAFQSKAA